MVTDVERDYLWSTYANDPRARVNVGIRRRLAPLMDNDRRKIELMNSLLLSFPGTPIIYYGDEIGMGDNIYLGDRNGVRTPMQWTPDRNGGFSRADPARLYAPTIMDPVYGYEAVNVEAQSRSLSSLLERHQAADLGAQVDAGVRPRHHDLHPSGQPLGARLCQAIWRRGDPLRRQPVAVGAGDRTRSVALEGAYPAGNARPHPLSGDRRIALHDHAGALRLLLVPADGARSVGARRAVGGSRIRDAGGAGGRDLGVAGPHPRRIRTRRAAWISGANTLVSGSLAGGYSPHPHLGGPVLRHRRQPPLARLLRSDAARRDGALRAADADRVGALRSRALQPARLRGRASGRAGRNLAGCRVRPDLHRASVVQFAPEPDRRRERLASRIQAHQQIRQPEPAGQAAPAYPRDRNRAMQQHGAGGS